MDVFVCVEVGVMGTWQSVSVCVCRQGLGEVAGCVCVRVCVRVCVCVCGGGVMGSGQGGRKEAGRGMNNARSPVMFCGVLSANFC